MNMTKTNVIIDCQILQTDDRNRGMGLYLYNLLNSLSDKNNDTLEWTFIINDSLSLATEDRKILDKFNGIVVKARLLTHKDKELYQEAHDINQNIIGKALSEQKTNALKTVFFIPALFSSEIYPVFPSEGSCNLILFHDIIPFLYYKQYFRDHEGHARKDYAQRWKEAYRADLFVTNSVTTADDLSLYFGIDPSRTIPILGAGAHGDIATPVKPSIQGLSKDYVLMPSGDDFRKNNQIAVSAFAELKNSIQLVITSRFSKETQLNLKDIYPNIIFSGSVSTSELLWLMDNTRFVFFPSEYEGLGMPLLEAVNRGAAIACSNIPVFREISRDAFTYFDPTSVSNIAESLENVLSKNNQSDLKQKYQTIKDKFSWKKLPRHS